MKLTINVVIVAADILMCISVQNIQETTGRNYHLQEVKKYITDE